MKKLLIGFLLAPWLCYGQNLTLKGTITDAKSGTLLPYAYVQIKGKALGTVTNSEGYFKLTVPKSLQNEMLVFSYVGYDSQETRANQLSSPVAIKLKPDTKMLDVVVIEPEKMIGPSALLRKIIKNIPTNYEQDTVLADAYYRELLKENGVYIKYADAVVQLNELPYQGDRFKGKEFAKGNYDVMTLGYASFYGGNRFHRYHYFNRTLLGEEAKIIESRSSDNLSTERMEANIEGGPLNLIGRDRIKYLEEFMRSAKKEKFNYKVTEQETKDNDWEYLLSFTSSVKNTNKAN